MFDFTPAIEEDVRILHVELAARPIVVFPLVLVRGDRQVSTLPPALRGASTNGFRATLEQEQSGGSVRANVYFYPSHLRQRVELDPMELGSWMRYMEHSTSSTLSIQCVISGLYRQRVSPKKAKSVKLNRSFSAGRSSSRLIIWVHRITEDEITPTPTFSPEYRSFSQKRIFGAHLLSRTLITLLYFSFVHAGSLPFPSQPQVLASVG